MNGCCCCFWNSKKQQQTDVAHFRPFTWHMNRRLCRLLHWNIWEKNICNWLFLYKWWVFIGVSWFFQWYSCDPGSANSVPLLPAQRLGFLGPTNWRFRRETTHCKNAPNNHGIQLIVIQYHTVIPNKNNGIWYLPIFTHSVCPKPICFKSRECGERVSFPPKGDFSGWRMWQPRILSQEDPSPILQRTVQSHVVVGSWIRMLIPWLPGTKKTCQTKEFGDVFFEGKTQKSIEVPKICIFFKTRTLPSPLSGVRGVTSMRCKQSKPLELHITNLSSPFLSFRLCVGSVVRRSSSQIASWPPQTHAIYVNISKTGKMEQGGNFHHIFWSRFPGFKRSLLLSRDNQKTQTEVENSWRRQSTKRTSMENFHETAEDGNGKMCRWCKRHYLQNLTGSTLF